MIISFEGMDGSGKSLQLEMFQRATDAVAIPQYVNLPKIYPSDMRVELFKRVEELRLELARMISPSDALMHLADSLSRDKIEVSHPYDIVLLDRSVDTTLAYSVLFFWKSLEAIRLDHALKIAGWHQRAVKPDLTFLFVAGYSEVKQRLQDGWAKSERRLDQEFDMMPEDKWVEVFQRYLNAAAAEPERIIRINANQSPDAVHAEVVAAYRARLKEMIK